MQCPKCGQELNCLLSLGQDLVTYEFDGEHYTEVDREADPFGPLAYICPRCEDTLAASEDEAKNS